MSYSRIQHGEIQTYALGYSRWLEVTSAFEGLMTTCVERGNGGAERGNGGAIMVPSK